MARTCFAITREHGRQKPSGCNRALIHRESQPSSLHGSTMRALRLTFPTAISRFRHRKILPPRSQAALARHLQGCG